MGYLKKKKKISASQSLFCGDKGNLEKANVFVNPQRIAALEIHKMPVGKRFFLCMVVKWQLNWKQ